MNPFFQLLFGLNEEALKGLKDDYESLVAQSIAYQNMGQFETAMKRLEQAIHMEENRFEGYFRRGQLNFIQGKIQQAQSDFDRSLAINKAHQESQLFKQKCLIELANSKLQQTQEEKIVEQIKKTDIYSSSGKLMYKWYQSDLRVGIEIHYALSNKDDLKYQLEKDKLSLSFPIKEDNTIFDLDLDLYAEINTETSKVKVGLTVIEIIMDKKDKKINWPKLQKVQEQEKIPEQASYPSSSQKRKNWDVIDKEIEEDISKHKEEYGEDPLSSLFKQIYANADENTRRAMVKSMQTSNGTVLQFIFYQFLFRSTNWDEVSKKDYHGRDRPSPPKGQEYKKWG